MSKIKQADLCKMLVIVLALAKSGVIHSGNRSHSMPDNSIVAAQKKPSVSSGAVFKSGRLDKASVPDSKEINPVSLTRNQTGVLTIRATQSSARQILLEIARHEGITVHYSAVPDTPITTTCSGSVFNQVLECLIGTRVNIAYRYSANTQPAMALAKLLPEEIWVLGIDRLDGRYTTLACSVEGKVKTSGEPVTPDSHDLLLQMTQVHDEQFADLRRQALTQLAAQGKTGDSAKDDATVQTLQKAFRDPDPEVKAQAVFGLANQDAPESSDILAEAIHDQNADVRLMAVDSANAERVDGQAVLQYALQDSDATVKAAASYKLGIDYVEPGK
jgi:hypothetical protein